MRDYMATGIAPCWAFFQDRGGVDSHARREAGVRAATLEGEAAGLQQQAEASKAIAEQARAEQERLKTLVSWRTLSQDQANVIGKALESGRGSVTIGWIANDPESLFLAIQIAGLFGQVNQKFPATWAVTLDPRSYSAELIWDISVPGPETEATTVIRRAFTAAKVAFVTTAVPRPVFQLNSMTTSGYDPATDAFIMIGSKRPPIP